MLSIQSGNGQVQNFSQIQSLKVNSGDKLKVSVSDDASLQVLIADNETDVILRVTNADGSTYDVTLEGLASLYEAGDIITQLLLDIDGEDFTVASYADLLSALDATAAGGGAEGGRGSFGDDAPNIDPNRGAAEDSDQLRSTGGLFEGERDGAGAPIVSNVFLVQNEVLGVEAAGDLNIITGQLVVTYDADFGDTHTFEMLPGTLSVTDTNGVITIIEDSIEATINPDGTYVIQGDFNDLSDGEEAVVTFQYRATDQTGLVSDPATVTFTVIGTNDIPVVEDINLNEQELEVYDYQYYGEDGDEGERVSSVVVFHETYDSTDVPFVDDTEDEGNNFFKGTLIVADDDVMNEGLHTFHIVKDEGDNNIVSVTGTTVVTADDITVGTVQNPDGSWSYTIDGDFGALAVGETATVSFQYYADDTRGFDGTDGIHESSISEPKTIMVTVTGTNDQPIAHEMSITQSEVVEGNNEFEGVLPGVTDTDVSDTHTYHGVGVEGIDYEVDSPSEVIIHSIMVNEDGSYQLIGDFNALAVGEEATVTFQYIVKDDSGVGSPGESDTSEPKTVTVTVIGTNDLPVAADDVITKVADHIEYQITDGICAFVWAPGIWQTATYQSNGWVGVNEHLWDSDDWRYIDSKGWHNDSVRMTLGKYVDNAEIAFKSIDSGDNVKIEVYNNGWQTVHAGPLVGSGNVGFVVDPGYSFRDLQITALDGNGRRCANTEFKINRVVETQIDIEKDIIDDFKVANSFILLNDTDIDGDVLAIKEGTVPLYDQSDTQIGTVTFGAEETVVDFYDSIEIESDIDGLAYFNYTVTDPHGGEATGTVNIDAATGTVVDNYLSYTPEQADQMVVGSDNDNIIDYEQVDLIDGNEGQDTLVFGSSDGNIDMAATLDGSIQNADDSETAIRNIEEIDLSAGTHLLSNLSADDVFAMTDSNNTLKISADSADGDNVTLTDEWTALNNGLPDGNGYVTYTATGGEAGEALELLIHEDIDVFTS